MNHIPYGLNYAVDYDLNHVTHLSFGAKSTEEKSANWFHFVPIFASLIGLISLSVMFMKAQQNKLDVSYLQPLLIIVIILFVFQIIFYNLFKNNKKATIIIIILYMVECALYIFQQMNINCDDEMINQYKYLISISRLCNIIGLLATYSKTIPFCLSSSVTR